MTINKHFAVTQDLSVEFIASAAHNAEFYSHISNDKFKHIRTLAPTGLNVDFSFPWVDSSIG